jgi:hypothetical protein
MNKELNIIEAENVRDIDIVTNEINSLLSQAQCLLLTFAVEIGRRLVEAKSLLPHGEWGSWLRERVGFSQSSANNYMKIFEEYGDEQITLFATVFAVSSSFAPSVLHSRSFVAPSPSPAILRQRYFVTAAKA